MHATLCSNHCGRRFVELAGASQIVRHAKTVPHAAARPHLRFTRRTLCIVLSRIIRTPSIRLQMSFQEAESLCRKLKELNIPGCNGLNVTRVHDAFAGEGPRAEALLHFLATNISSHNVLSEVFNGEELSLARKLLAHREVLQGPGLHRLESAANARRLDTEGAAINHQKRIEELTDRVQGLNRRKSRLLSTQASLRRVEQQGRLQLADVAALRDRGQSVAIRYAEAIEALRASLVDVQHKASTIGASEHADRGDGILGTTAAAMNYLSAEHCAVEQLSDFIGSQFHEIVNQVC